MNANYYIAIIIKFSLNLQFSLIISKIISINIKAEFKEFFHGILCYLEYNYFILPLTEGNLF